MGLHRQGGAPWWCTTGVRHSRWSVYGTRTVIARGSWLGMVLISSRPVALL